MLALASLLSACTTSDPPASTVRAGLPGLGTSMSRHRNENRLENPQHDCATIWMYCPITDGTDRVESVRRRRLCDGSALQDQKLLRHNKH